MGSVSVHPGDVLISRSALRHQPGREGRKAPKTYGHTAIPADLLKGNYCEQVVHSCYIQLGLQPAAGHPSPGQGPSRAGRAVQSNRSNDSGLREQKREESGIWASVFDEAHLLPSGAANYGRAPCFPHGFQRSDRVNSQSHLVSRIISTVPAGTGAVL